MRGMVLLMVQSAISVLFCKKETDKTAGHNFIFYQVSYIIWTMQSRCWTAQYNVALVEYQSVNSIDMLNSGDKSMHSIPCWCTCKSKVQKNNEPENDTYIHRVDRVLGFFSSRPLWLPRPLIRRRVCPSPFGSGGWDTCTRLLERGWGSPNSDEGIDTVVL